MSDDAKKFILARRAKFIAAAVASLGLAEADCKPQPCLSVAAPQDAGPEAEPMPCLSPVANPDYDAGLPPPQPCLSVAAPQDAGPDGIPPQACLSIAPRRPKDAGK